MAKVVNISIDSLKDAFQDIKSKEDTKGVHSYTNVVYNDGSITISIEAKANITTEEVVDEEKTAEEQAKMDQRKAEYEARLAEEKATAEAEGLTVEEYRQKKQQEAIDADYARRAEAEGITVDELKAKEKAEEEAKEAEQKQQMEDYIANQLVERGITREEYDAEIAEKKVEREKKSAEWNAKWRAEECEKYNCSDEDLDRVMEEYNQAHMWDANPVMKNILVSKDSILPHIVIQSEDVMFGGFITTEIGDIDSLKTSIGTEDEYIAKARGYFASDKFATDVANFNQENDTDLEINLA